MAKKKKLVEIPAYALAIDEAEDARSDVKHDVEHGASVKNLEQEGLERQRELNDNLALIRILDSPAPFGNTFPSMPQPNIRSSKQRRQTLLNFIAFCLAHDNNNTVALAATIHRSDASPNGNNRIVLHIARSTGTTTSYERERAYEFLSDLKRAWRHQAYECMQIVMGHVVQMTSNKLRKRLKKLRDALHDLSASVGFAHAVDEWGKQESSRDIVRWMETVHCESPTEALKDIVERLSASADSDDFDTPHLFDAAGQYRLYHSYLFPVAVLLSSHFLHDVEFGHTSLAPNLVHLIRQLRWRCIQFRWYEVGIHLFCTWARDSLQRILGTSAFDKFLHGDEDDALTIDWLDTPDAMPEPMPRRFKTAQDALVNILATISSDNSDEDEPFACTITDKPLAATYWTPTCVAVYHPELQIIDHLRKCNMHPSPAFVGCSQFTCRACKFYVEHLDGCRWSLYTGELHTMDLETPVDWLMPPSETGLLCASIIREEAARLVLREDNIQRIAWEMRSTSEALGLDELEAANSDGELTLDLPVVEEGDDSQIDAASGGQC